MFRKKKKASREEIVAQWLDLFPLRQREYETDEEGNVTVLVPHPENWFTRILPKPKNWARRVHLDPVGSRVWSLCDGQHSIRQIARLLEEEFGESVRPTHERTVMFVQQMYQQEFVKMFEKREEHTEQ